MVASISIEERDLANQHLDRSISFAMCGKIDQAITEAKKAVEIDPDFYQAYNKLGDYYLKKGKITEAIDVYRKSIVLNPTSENSNFDLGRSLAIVGNYDEALYYLNKALKLNPNHSEIYCHTGLIYLEKNDLQRAITDLETALQHDRDNLMAHYLLAIAKLKVGKDNEAHQIFQYVIDQCTSLIKAKSNFAEGYYYIGKSYFYMGELDKALDNLKKAVEFDTEAVDYHYSFGMLYSDADAFFALAEVFYALDDKTEAIANLKNALNLDPQNKKYQELKLKLGL